MRLFRGFVGLVAVGVLGLAIMVPATVARSHVDLHATLHSGLAFPGAGGFSNYDRGGGVREVTVTVTGVPQLQGKRVSFFVAGARIGSRLIDRTGSASIERQTIHGQFVPFASAGNVVRVRTAGGEQIALGTYHRVQ
jgi:hypothetical protein